MHDSFDKTQDMFGKVYNKALRFLSYRQRSEKEVRENLLKPKSRSSKKVEEVGFDLVQKVIDKLKDQKFLNDEEFARAWVESRSRFKPRALRIIKMELKQKGISQEIIEKILGFEDIKLLSEVEMARKLIEKKAQRYKNVSPTARKIKLGQHLAGKGFNWDTIKEVLGEAES